MYISFRDFVNIIIDFPKPIIGVVQGSAVGLGCAILPLLDCVYASERASFLLPYSTLEQGPEACSSLLLPKIMGYSAVSIRVVENAYFLYFFLYLGQRYVIRRTSYNCDRG